MLCKYYLQIGSDTVDVGSVGCIDVSVMLSNIGDINMSYTRSEMSGVIRKFGSEFRLTGYAMESLVWHYVNNGLDSKAAMAVYVIDDNWNFSQAWECRLDFSTFTYTPHDCGIRAVDNSLASVIKAKASTKFEYLVSDIKDDVPLHYDHLKLNNFVKWIVAGDGVDNDGNSTVGIDTSNDGSAHVMMSYSSVELSRGVDVSYDNVQSYQEHAFFRTFRDIEVHLTGKLVVKYGWNSSSFVGLALRIFGNGHTVYMGDIYNDPDNFHTFDIDTTFTMNAGIGNVMYMFLGGWYDEDDMPSDLSGIVAFGAESFLSAEFKWRTDPETCDVVTPAVLLQSLVNSMTGSEDTACSIENMSEVMRQTYIVAAESARDIADARLYTSYNDFCSFMSAVFGYVPVIGTDEVKFVKRDSLFANSQIKQIDGRNADLSVSADSSMIYSKILVGYDDQEYESVNGRDEWRFTTEYNTGTDLTDNELEIRSKYRADAYGIEFLFQRRGEDTTDSGADEDVFIVHARYDDELSAFSLMRGITCTGVLDPDSMFNAVFTPLNMILANASYIASFAKLLTFASSGGNSDVVIDGHGVGEDVVMEGNSMFLPAKLTVKTSDVDIPVDWSGYISLSAGGYTYAGYLSDVTFGFGKDKPASYEMILKTINPES